MPTERQMRQFRKVIESQSNLHRIVMMMDSLARSMFRVPDYYGKTFRVLLLDPREPKFEGLSKYITTGKD